MSNMWINNEVVRYCVLHFQESYLEHHHFKITPDCRDCVVCYKLQVTVVLSTRRFTGVVLRSCRSRVVINRQILQSRRPLLKRHRCFISQWLAGRVCRSGRSECGSNTTTNHQSAVHRTWSQSLLRRGLAWSTWQRLALVSRTQRPRPGSATTQPQPIRTKHWMLQPVRTPRSVVSVVMVTCWVRWSETCRWQLNTARGWRVRQDLNTRQRTARNHAVSWVFSHHTTLHQTTPDQTRHVRQGWNTSPWTARNSAVLVKS